MINHDLVQDIFNNPARHRITLLEHQIAWRDAEIDRLKAQAARDAALVALVLEEARLRLTRDDPGLITDWVIYQDWQKASASLEAAVRARIEEDQ